MVNREDADRPVLNLRRNTALSVVEVVVNGAGLFVLVTLLYAHVGAKGIGLWSLVMGVVSVIRVAELGIAFGLSRRIARWSSRVDGNGLGAFIYGALIVSLCLQGALVVAGAGPAVWVLRRFVDPALMPEVLHLLPLAALSVMLSTLASCLHGVLTGLHRSDLRSVISMLSGILFVGLTAALLGARGLEGAVLAQIAQGAFVLVTSAIVAGRLVAGLFRPRRPAIRPIFDLIAGYGLAFQGTTLVAIVLEPTTKFLLAAYASLEAVGYFEMAIRVVQQARNVVAAPNLALIAAFADLERRDMDSLRMLYVRSFDLTLLLGPLAFAAVVLAAPILGEVWTGHAAPLFVLFCGVLATGHLIAAMALPAQSLFLGLGLQRWTFAAQVTTALLNGLLGAILGALFATIGVAVALALALALGALVLIVPGRRWTGVGMRTILGVNGIAVLATAAMGTVVASGAFFAVRGHHELLLATSAMLVTFGLFVALPVLSHPLARKAVAGVRSRVTSRRLF
jgi:O-antigen/teichoic acid export membrane protein